MVFYFLDYNYIHYLHIKPFGICESLCSSSINSVSTFVFKLVNSVHLPSKLNMNIIYKYIINVHK